MNPKCTHCGNESKWQGVVKEKNDEFAILEAHVCGVCLKPVEEKHEAIYYKDE